MKLMRPLPARATRLISFSVVGAWVVTIFVLIQQAYRTSPVSMHDFL